MDRKEQIVKETYDLIMQYGLSGTTIAQIASRVGVSGAALYNHFKNRDDILLTVLEQAISHFIDRTTNIPPDEPDYIPNLIFETMNNTKDFMVIFNFICSHPYENLRVDSQRLVLNMLSAFKQILAAGIAQGSLRHDINPNQIVWELFSLGSAFFFDAMLDQPKEHREYLLMNSMEQLVSRIRSI